MCCFLSPLAQKPFTRIMLRCPLLILRCATPSVRHFPNALFTVPLEFLRWCLGAPNSVCYGGAFLVCTFGRSCIASLTMAVLGRVKETVHPIYGGAKAVCKRLLEMLRSLPHFVVRHPSKILNTAPLSAEKASKCLYFRLFSGFLLPPFGRFSPVCFKLLDESQFFFDCTIRFIGLVLVLCSSYYFYSKKIVRTLCAI